MLSQSWPIPCLLLLLPLATIKLPPRCPPPSSSITNSSSIDQPNCANLESNGWLGTLLVVEGAANWKKPAKKGRPPLMAGEASEESDEEEQFFFQMDEIPSANGGRGRSRENELPIKNNLTAKEGKSSKEARERSTNGRMEFSGQTKPVEATTQATSLATMRRVEEKKRSASREIQEKVTARPIVGNGKASASSAGHHQNITLSSHHRKKSGQTITIGQKRLGSGGNKQGNWHELSSTEQSIALMLRCQDLETRELLPSAVTCRNLRSDKVCNYLFHEVDRKTGRRDVKCNLQGLEDIAESCRKTCGICCEDINYACEDDRNDIIDCPRQLEKCHQKKWFGVLSRFCAGSCGLCAMTPCRDYDNSCRVRKALCLKPDTMDYMRENCARTCGFCLVGEEAGGGEHGIVKGGGGQNGKGGGGEGDRPTVISGKPVIVERSLSQQRLIVPECTDKASNCTTNAHLCGSPQYGEYMVKFCTKTCLKCGQPHASKNGKFPLPPPLEVVIQPLLGEAESKRRPRKCEDLDEKCAQWKSEGLCQLLGNAKNGNGKKFSQEQRDKICPKTCGQCQ